MEVVNFLVEHVCSPWVDLPKEEELSGGSGAAPVGTHHDHCR